MEIHAVIRIEEIPTDQLDAFWEMHYAYLLQDGIISDAEDRAYFKSDEYRGAIRRNMGRSTDRHHLIYFTEGMYLNGKDLLILSCCALECD